MLKLQRLATHAGEILGQLLHLAQPPLRLQRVPVVFQQLSTLAVVNLGAHACNQIVGSGQGFLLEQIEHIFQ